MADRDAPFSSFSATLSNSPLLESELPPIEGKQYVLLLSDLKIDQFSISDLVSNNVF